MSDLVGQEEFSASLIGKEDPSGVLVGEENPTGNLAGQESPTGTLTGQEGTTGNLVGILSAGLEIKAEIIATGPRGVPGAPGPQGLPGPPGEAGTGYGTDITYVHTQLTPASEWTVVHNLQKFPSISVVDSAGSEVEGDVRHIDPTCAVITFCAAFAGKVFLN